MKQHMKSDNIYSTQYFAILMVRENVDSIIDRIRDFREAGAHFFQLNLLHGIHLGMDLSDLDNIKEI